MVDYIFNTNPGTFYIQNQAIIVSLILLGLSILGFYLLKKRREFIKLNKDQRLAMYKACKINMFVSGALVVFVLFRAGQISFLSMRLFPILLGIAMAVLYSIGLIKLIKYRDQEDRQTVIVDEYAKYLPHKKKK